MKKLLLLLFLCAAGVSAGEKYQYIPLPSEGVGKLIPDYKAQVKNCRVDEDELSDLVVFYGDHIYIYFQNEDGTYGEKLKAVRRPDPGKKAAERDALFRRVEPNYTIDNPNASAFFLEDLDSDGLPEIVTITKSNDSSNDTVNVFWNKGNWDADEKEPAKKESKEEADGEDTDAAEDEIGFAEEDDVFGAPIGAFLLALKDINGDGKTDLVFLTTQGVEACLQNARDFGERKILFKADSIASWINRETNQLQRSDFVEDVNKDGRMEYFIPVIGGVDVWSSNERGEYSKQTEIRYDARQLPVRLGPRHTAEEDNIQIQPGEFEGADMSAMFILPAISFEDVDRDGGKEAILNLGARNESAWKFDAKQNKYSEIPSFRRPWGMRVETKYIEETNQREYRMILDRNEALNPAREPDIVRMQTPFTPEGLRSNIDIFFNSKSLPCLPDSSVPDLSQAGTSFREGNILQQLVYGDVNGDNRLDFVFFATKYQITNFDAWLSAIKGNLKGDVIFYFYDPSLKGGKIDEQHRIPFGYQTKTNGDFLLRDVKMSYKLDGDFLDQRIFDIIESAISLNGDFNRDGKKDLLLRTTNNTIQLYFNTGNPGAWFPNSPNTAIKAPNYTGLEIVDFNGDGVSDLFFSGLQGDDIEIPPGATSCRHLLAVSISEKKE